jgi:fatty acid desaturase
VRFFKYKIQTQNIPNTGEREMKLVKKIKDYILDRLIFFTAIGLLVIAVAAWVISFLVIVIIGGVVFLAIWLQGKFEEVWKKGKEVKYC